MSVVLLEHTRHARDVLDRELEEHQPHRRLGQRVELLEEVLDALLQVCMRDHLVVQALLTHVVAEHLTANVLVLDAPCVNEKIKSLIVNPQAKVQK